MPTLPFYTIIRFRGIFATIGKDIMLFHYIGNIMLTGAGEKEEPNILDAFVRHAYDRE